MQRITPILLLTVGVALISCSVWAIFSKGHLEDKSVLPDYGDSLALALYDELKSGVPRRMDLDLQGIENPVLLSATEATLSDDEQMICLVEFGEARAYRLSAFRKHPSNHLIHDQLGSAPIVVSHCDVSGCTRVFQARSANIRVGGINFSKQMLLRVDDKIFPLDSPEIPLEEVDFVVTTWKQWREMHPDTRVYLGNSQTSSKD